MKVFIANFGIKNQLWPTCLSQSILMMYEDEDTYPFVARNDKSGFIDHCRATKKTAVGNTPTVPVASRWFNLHEIISKTGEDLWIHREKNELWWTFTRTDAADVSLEELPALFPGGEKFYVTRKKTNAWSNENRKENRLEWAGLHAKAKHFLFTESTFQKLSPDNAAYAVALIEGDSLTPWHTRRDWENKAKAAGRNPVLVFNAKQLTVASMVMTAYDTAKHSYGQQVNRTVKSKEVKFSGKEEFERYVETLIDDQEGLCAVTGIRLQFEKEYEDSELLCSLDRIDSDRHYEIDNLQVVCRFVNRWKSDSNDDEFRRLIDLVRAEHDLSSGV